MLKTKEDQYKDLLEEAKKQILIDRPDLQPEDLETIIVSRQPKVQKWMTD